MYNLIGDELFKMGGVYIKFLQGVILQSWLMQRWQNKHKLDIFEKIDAKNLDIESILERNLGQRRSEILELKTPAFAVGSFGHVYEAKLKNGQRIIVKALTPDISRTLKFDLRLLKFFWYFHLRSIKFNKSLNLKLVFEDFRNQTLQEINYASEAEFADRQYATFKKHAKLVIPRTHLELCTKEIIVQDYVDGLSVTHLLRMQEKDSELDLCKYVKEKLNSNLEEQLKTLGYELLWGTFHHKQVMGDPHPGNVILLRNDKIALIDFGIAARSSQDPVAYLKLIKAYYALTCGKVDPQDIFSASLRFFGKDLYLALAKLSNLTPKGGQRINLNKELSKIMENIFKEAFGKQDMKALTESPKALVMFERMTNKNNRFGFQLRIRDTEMLRTLITWTSLLSLLNLYTQVMKPVYAKVIEKVEKVYPDLQTLADTEISHNQALNIIFGWLERIAIRDPTLFRDLLDKMALNKKFAPEVSQKAKIEKK